MPKKYLFAPIILFLIYLGFQINESYNKIDMQPLRISWYNNSKLEKYDPATIQFASHSLLLMNIYSTLVEYNSTSSIVNGLADKITWISDNEVDFTIRDGIKTPSGYTITAEDAYFSLKRLVFKQSNLHGELQSFICPGLNLINITSDCPGLSFNKNILKIKILDKHKSKFLIPLLTSTDFSIIPKNAIDWNSSDLKIINYSETSGPYYVSKISDSGEHEITSNKTHYNYSIKMPHIVRLVPVLDDTSVQKLKNNEIDLITTIDRASRKELLAMSKNNNFSAHVTLPINSLAIYVSRRGLSRLTSDERLQIGQKIKINLFKVDEFKEIYTSTNEFFSEFGDASLSAEQRSNLNIAFKRSEQLNIDTKIKISILDANKSLLKSALANIENIEITNFTIMPNDKEIHDQEDMYIVDSDTGFFENISMISYYASGGDLGLSKKESTVWLDMYTKIDDKIERLNKLRELHYNVLANANIIPIGVLPYVSIANKKYKYNMYKEFGGTPLWMIQTN